MVGVLKIKNHELTYINKAISRLHGILGGIAADYKITDAEVIRLNDWLESHEALAHVEPFFSIHRFLKSVLEDGIIDDDEREDILDLCQRISDPYSFQNRSQDAAIRWLHGYLHGAILDGRLTDDEVEGFQEWLYDMEEFENVWPFCDVWAILRHVLEDNKVSDDEREMLSEFFKQFAEIPADKIVDHDKHDDFFAGYDLPVFKSFVALCDRSALIQFERKSFCFTGQAETGPRRELHKIVESLGGTHKKNVTAGLDYLVIGALSNPTWAFSTYGRKIEKVVEYRRGYGKKIAILHEHDFIDQTKKALP